MFSEFNEIKSRILKGERVNCTICNSPFIIQEVRENSDEIECINGHMFSLIESLISVHGAHCIELSSLWLEPIESLNFGQLKLIKEIVGLSSTNLIEIKKKYSDGKRHILIKEEYPNVIKEISEKLISLNIPFSVERNR